jgi:nucleotide-binding universal stress UspA family protein
MTTNRAPERIVVGLDGSLASRAAVRWALHHAHPGDTVHLVHALEPSPSIVRAGLADDDQDSSAQSLLRRELSRAEQLHHSSDIIVTGQVLRGDPRRCLVDVECDAIVVGSGGHGVVTRAVLGSVCSHLANHAAVPVTVIPDPRRRRKHGDSAAP